MKLSTYLKNIKENIKNNFPHLYSQASSWYLFYQLSLVKKQPFAKSPKAKAVVQRRSVKKVRLKNSQNLQENTRARVSFLVAGLRLATLLKKTHWHKCFPTKLLKTPYFIERLWWLLLQRFLSKICEISWTWFFTSIRINKKITVQEIKFSIKDFFSKCLMTTSFFVQWIRRRLLTH